MGLCWLLCLLCCGAGVLLEFSGVFFAASTNYARMPPCERSGFKNRWVNGWATGACVTDEQVRVAPGA